MSTFVSVAAGVSIEGQISSREVLAERASVFLGGLLYLCPDTDGDVAIEKGTFTDALTAFGGNAVHVAFNASLLPPTSHVPDSQDETKRVLHALSLYTAIENGLLSRLRGPGDKLIVCKSNRRAGCAFACVDFVTKHLHTDLSAYLKACKEKGYFTFVDAPAFVLWVQTVVEWKRKMSPTNLVIRQLFDKQSSTYTYLLGDETTREAILIDPVKEHAERDAKLVSELGYSLRYALNTHVHADHITSTGVLKSLLSPPPLSVISKASGAQADVLVDDYSILSFANGTRHVFTLSTPGHTAGCMSFVIFDAAGTLVFSGDALLIRGCGRTDFQGGSAEALYDSVHSRLFVLPPAAVVYPAHNYVGLPFTTIGEEKALNPRLTKTKAEFVELMAGLNLPNPAMIDEAVPANLKCGV